MKLLEQKSCRNKNQLTDSYELVAMKSSVNYANPSMIGYDFIFFSFARPLEKLLVLNIQSIIVHKSFINNNCQRHSVWTRMEKKI